MNELWSVATVGALSTTVALAILRPLLLSWGHLDVPNHRSSHVTPTVRSGGFGVLAGVLAASIVGSLSRWDPSLISVMLGTTLLCLLGLWEDLRGLSTKTRLFGQGGISLLLLTALLRPSSALSLIIVPILMLCYLFYINAANFMDGINAISGLHAFVGGAYFALAGIIVQNQALVVFATSIAVCFASFLPWNAPVAKLFLGDSGSYLLGASVMSLTIWSIASGLHPIASVAPTVIYTADVSWTLLQRARLGLKLTEAHRDHVYQKLQRIARSHLISATVCTGATLTCCLSALAVLEQLISPTTVMLIYLGTACLYLALPTLLMNSAWKERTR